MSIAEIVNDIRNKGLLKAGNRLEELYSKAMELEAENARLRQQRDAANAQLDFILEQNGKAP